MMDRKRISINNKPVETEATTLGQLAEEQAWPAQGVAVAVENRLVPRAEWADHTLTEGCSVVVIKAACGG